MTLVCGLDYQMMAYSLDLKHWGCGDYRVRLHNGHWKSCPKPVFTLSGTSWLGTSHSLIASGPFSILPMLLSWLIPLPSLVHLFFMFWVLQYNPLLSPVPFTFCDVRWAGHPHPQCPFPLDFLFLLLSGRELVEKLAHWWVLTAQPQCSGCCVCSLQCLLWFSTLFITPHPQLESSFLNPRQSPQLFFSPCKFTWFLFFPTSLPESCSQSFSFYFPWWWPLFVEVATVPNFTSYYCFLREFWVWKSGLNKSEAQRGPRVTKTFWEIGHCMLDLFLLVCGLQTPVVCLSEHPPMNQNLSPFQLPSGNKADCPLLQSEHLLLQAPPPFFFVVE